MNRKFLLSCGLIVLMAAVGCGLGPGARAGACGRRGRPPPLVDDDVDVSGIEQILRGEEEVLEGGSSATTPRVGEIPSGRSSRASKNPEEGPAKARPPGLPGMMIEELRLEGIIETPSGILAFVLGRDNVSYIIRPGTKLFNGEVGEIQPKKVVFRKDVNDPNRNKQYEEVVREITD